MSQTDIKCTSPLKKSETICKCNKMRLLNYMWGEKMVYLFKILFQVYIFFHMEESKPHLEFSSPFALQWQNEVLVCFTHWYGFSYLVTLHLLDYSVNMHGKVEYMLLLFSICPVFSKPHGTVELQVHFLNHANHQNIAFPLLLVLLLSVFNFS